jgi:c-di-GMP-binding flagellar brake protein YcgR
MSNDGAEKISGSSRVAILNQLRKDMTMLQLIMTGTNYERLTLLSDLIEEGGKSYVLVDCPETFVEDVPNHRGAGIRIEFMGKERVQYSFSSKVTKVSEKNIWMELPEYLERVQRRQFFRIAPPPGTRISFPKIGTPQDASIINLSEGGALVTLDEPARGSSRLLPEENLRNIRLRCRAENLNADIRIEEAAVLREHTEHGKEKAAYALIFLEMDPRERRLLQEFIFMCQREILRKRKE